MDRELELKVGDIVTIRKDLEVRKYYGSFSVPIMEQYRGKEGIIIDFSN